MALLHNSLILVGRLEVSLAFYFERTKHLAPGVQRLHDDNELAVEVVCSFLRRYRILQD